MVRRYYVFLIFSLFLRSQTSINWRLCSSRQSSGDRRADTTESPTAGSIGGQTSAVTSTAFSSSEAIKSNETKAKITLARSIFVVDVPAVGHFERQLDFRTIIGRNRDDIHSEQASFYYFSVWFSISPILPQIFSNIFDFSLFLRFIFDFL